MKTYTDFIIGGFLEERGEHIYLTIHNDKKTYQFHIPKTLFEWFLTHKKISSDKIVSKQEALKMALKKVNSGYVS